MAGAALRRLLAEYKQLTLNPPEGILAGPVDEENFFEWEALITGPDETCFEGGVFPAKLMFPPDYPLSPPKMKFTCDLFHPNVTKRGKFGTLKNDIKLRFSVQSIPASGDIRFACNSFPHLEYVHALHTQVYSDGRVCISILHAPGDDPTGYETRAERWSPVQSVEKILLSVVSLLAEPNDESPANVDAAKMWRDNREEFNAKTVRLVRSTLGLPPPES